jgi:hypothetical protein
VDQRAADISPPTDDRPYFFQMANLNTFFNGDILSDDLATRPVLVLGMLAVTVLLLAAVCVALPLLLKRRRGTTPAPAGFVPFYVYFASIGFGFLVIEVSQLQRLSIFLGHPTHALTVVLFSVLLSSGIGSMLTERFVDAQRPRTLIGPLIVLLGLLVLFGLATPAVIGAMAGASSTVRIATAVVLLAPLGLALGTPFVIGMRAAALRPGAPTAFLWGINGAMSVCASVFGIVIALFFGIAAAFRVGVLAYVLAAISMAMIFRSQRPSAPSEEAELREEPVTAEPVLPVVVPSVRD